MANYLTDSGLTDRLAATLTNTQLSDSTKRANLVIAPASAWVDSVFPYKAPFADISASPSTPNLIHQGAIEFALWLAYRILNRDPANPAAKIAKEAAYEIFQIDEKTGLARVLIPGIDEAVRVGIVDLTRSRDAEEDNERTKQDALWPGGGP